MKHQAQGFLSAERWRGKIFASGWSEPTGGVIEIREPATDGVLGSIGRASPADVAVAARKARIAQAAWATLLPQERGAYLQKAADLFETHAEELTEWIMRESGSVRGKAAIEVNQSALFLRHAAAIAMESNGIMLPAIDAGRTNIAKRVPHGVVGVITPFNFPLVLSIRVIAPALALGNAIVHKPDPRTNVSGGVIIARIFEEAGLPEGLLQIVFGGAETGEAICADPNIAMVSFTGSEGGGRKVGEVAGRNLKKVQLELGGKNALIVLDDADVDVAASNAAWGAFFHQGQICMSTGVVLAQEGIADQLAERLAVRAARLQTGDPREGAPALGPIINEDQVERIQALVDDAIAKGARVLSGGTHERLFYKATVLAGVTPDMRIYDEEVFGPVISVVPFKTDADAVKIVNGSDYGLAAGVISDSLGRAQALGTQLNVGQLHINDQTVNGGPYAPFGGRGHSGNGSRISGPALWEEFTQWVWMSVKEKATPYPF